MEESKDTELHHQTVVLNLVPLFHIHLYFPYISSDPKSSLSTSTLSIASSEPNVSSLGLIRLLLVQFIHLLGQYIHSHGRRN